MLSLCAVLVLTLAAGPSAADDFDSQLSALAGSVETTAIRGDENGLRSAIAELEKLSSLPVSPVQGSTLKYTVAFARWRMAVQPSVKDKDRDQLLDTAAKELEAAVKMTPKSAEALGLLGSVYGMRIGGSMFKGMTLGPKAGSRIDEARKLEPSNPRIVMQAGVGAFQTPGMFGGGNDKAERLLREALTLFEKEPQDKPWPNWGRLDAHAWLGQVLLKKGDRAGAKQQYEKALAVAPESAWVRSVLLPALEKRTGR